MSANSQKWTSIRDQIDGAYFPCDRLMLTSITILELPWEIMVSTTKNTLRTELIKEFLKFFIPVSLLFLSSFVFLHILDYQNKTELKLVEEDHHTKVLQSAAYNDLEHLALDVLVLADSEALQTYLGNKTANNYKKASDRLVTFASDRSTYDQVRFLDERGMEIFRVNRDQDSKAFTPAEVLQDKSDRYYFAQSIVLDKHDIYFSPLDLNVEDGQIERPHKPMLRVATPVFDENNTKRGVLIVNYLAQAMLDRFSDQIQMGERHEYALVNADGFWLHGAEGDLNFSFMFGKADTFATRYPMAWGKIQSGASGQFFTPKGAFTFVTVNPTAAHLLQNAPQNMDLPPANSEIYWKIISFQSQANIGFNFFDKTHRLHWALFCGLIMITALASFWFAKQRQIKIEIERNLIISKEEAEIANKAKSDFLASMSHDLRTPLNAIMGFSDMMRQQEFGPLNNKHYEEYANDIYNSGKLLVSLINDVLDLSKIEAGKYELTSEAVSISAIVNTCTRQLSNLASIGGQTVTHDVPSDLPQLVGDERVLLQVLNNLLSNAIKFSHDGGMISVSAYLNDMNGITITVKDTGIGMPEGGIEKALRPFEQADGSHTRRHEGTGLGLHLCTNFMKLFSGTLEIESEIDKGTKVILTFPPERTINP